MYNPECLKYTKDLKFKTYFYVINITHTRASMCNSKFAAKTSMTKLKGTKTWCPIQTVSKCVLFVYCIYCLFTRHTHKLYNQKRGNFTPVQWRTNFKFVGVCTMHEPSIYAMAMIFKPFYLFYFQRA